MRYKVIYEIKYNEQGEIMDLVNKAEFFTQSKCAEWLGVNQSTVSRAIKSDYKSDLTSENIIDIGRVSYAIIEC